MVTFSRHYLWVTLIVISLALPGCLGGERGASQTATPVVLEPGIAKKVSPRLVRQIELRTQQLARPSEGRAEEMAAQGMSLSTLSLQKVFVHFSQAPAQLQITELQNAGITLHLSSWIPPVGNAPTGFLLADMPVDKLTFFASRDYVVKLETAETTSQPQSNP
ncbi:MAG: hypothetical protein U1D67_07490 [Dehalococcoidia bacterium]|nr:hypothetical protein [Dehalococcoidia bacterium]